MAFYDSFLPIMLHQKFNTLYAERETAREEERKRRSPQAAINSRKVANPRARARLDPVKKTTRENIDEPRTQLPRRAFSHAK